MASLDYMRRIRFGGHWKEVMDRDGWKCVKCGMSNEEHKKIFGINLTIDHKNKRGRYADIPDNRPENLQVLCLRCHGQKDAWKHGKWSVYRPMLVCAGKTQNSTLTTEPSPVISKTDTSKS